MDQAVFHLINERWTSPVLDLFMAAISDVQIWKPLLILVALYVLIFRNFRGRALVLCIALTLLVSDTLVVKSLKTAVGRLRPKQAQSVRMVQLQRTSPEFLTLFKRPTIRYSDASDRNTSGPSFPSGHVTDNVVIATCCLLFFRRWGWLYLIVAAAIGYSRIYLGAHWPSDVVATAFMAAGETFVIVALLELLWRNTASRLAPAVFARHPRLVGDPNGRSFAVAQEKTAR
ncbi:MAG: phosphatase PAP2 family protein [Verrucomicrobiota bacterium]|nr:phosphatase PAP2 family protein [Verrucomicrobiota bacterium]